MISTEAPGGPSSTQEAGSPSQSSGVGEGPGLDPILATLSQCALGKWLPLTRPPSSFLKRDPYAIRGMLSGCLLND